MTLDAAAQMRRSTNLKQRIESAAYAQGQTMQWVDRNIATICATPSWASAWSAAWIEMLTDGIEKPDVGARRSVIGDDMIDAAVTAVVEAEQAPAPEPAVTQADYVALAAQVADLEARLAQALSQSSTTNSSGSTEGIA